MIIAKSREDILNDIKTRIKQLGIEPLTVGITQSMVEGIADILYSAEVDRIATDNETNPSLATGTQLENIASREFGIVREVGDTVSDTTFTNFHFYLAGSARAKDITTDSAGFTIPANVFIRDVLGNLFMTTLPAIFEQNSNSAFTQIVSINPVQNEIPALSLTQHDFDMLNLDNVNTTSLGTTTLLCANNKSLPSTSTNETDDSLRLRYYQRANSLNQSNDQRLQSLLTSIPGITGVQLRKNKRGNGSVECILQTQLANPSDGIYARAQGLIQQNIYGADNIFVVTPQYLPLQITLRIIAEGKITNLPELKSTLSIGGADFVNNSIRQGGTFVVKDFLSALTALVTGIDRLEIDCIYVNNRRAVIKDQTAFYNQKFVVLSPLDIIIK